MNKERQKIIVDFIHELSALEFASIVDPGHEAPTRLHSTARAFLEEYKDLDESNRALREAQDMIRAAHAEACAEVDDLYNQVRALERLQEEAKSALYDERALRTTRREKAAGLLEAEREANKHEVVKETLRNELLQDQLDSGGVVPMSVLTGCCVGCE